MTGSSQGRRRLHTRARTCSRRGRRPPSRPQHFRHSGRRARPHARAPPTAAHLAPPSWPSPTTRRSHAPASTSSEPPLGGWAGSCLRPSPVLRPVRSGAHAVWPRPPAMAGSQVATPRVTSQAPGAAPPWVAGGAAVASCPVSPWHMRLPHAHCLPTWSQRVPAGDAVGPVVLGRPFRIFWQLASHAMHSPVCRSPPILMLAAARALCGAVFGLEALRTAPALCAPHSAARRPSWLVALRAHGGRDPWPARPAPSLRAAA